MTTKYIAKLDGKIVGRRTTKGRTYTHAVVTQLDAALARDAAYNYVATSSDHSNFAYYTGIVEQGTDHEHIRTQKWRSQPDYAALDRARVAIEGGFDAYVARLRQTEIERFEQRLADGYYEPHAVTWAGRPDLAQKEASRRTHCKTWIVPAEMVR